MDRQQKETVVSNLKEMFETTPAAFLVCYKGLKVSHMESLREDLREVGGVLKVTKARLMKIAAQDIDGIDTFKDVLKDQVGLVFVKDEVPAVAKKLVGFSKNNEALKIISGFFESKSISAQEINYLASLPSREVLLSQLMGTLLAPTTNFARVMHMMIVRLLYVLKQVSEKEA